MTTSARGERRVVVVGAGLAGVAAATALAERGVRVTLLERESFLGGRAGSWADRLRDGTVFEMERGFHAFFRHYENVRALLRRVDPGLSCLAPLDDYPILGPDGAEQSFAGLPKRPPFNVAALLWRSKDVAIGDLRHADLDRARAMLAFDQTRTYERFDRESASDFLDSLRFPERARRMLFDVFAHSFFNPEEDYSAAELLAMFHFYFTGNAAGLLFDVTRRPLGDAIWRPLERHLAGLGVTIEKGASCTSVERIGAELRARFRQDGQARAVIGDAVVLAVTVPALRDLVSSSIALAPLASDMSSLAVTLPFAVLRLWLDAPCAAHRAPFAGTTGLGILDNVSIYEKLQTESAAWAARTKGSVVELHAYALDEDLPASAIRAELVAGLHRAYPETRAASIVDERLLIRRDCPAFQPGSHARRPAVRTAAPGIYLAGDFVRLDFPSALMERAVSSGFLAANEILRSHELAPVKVSHGPTRGMFAALDAWAESARPGAGLRGALAAKRRSAG
ncbi:MAG TPA: FAD-dependent oxidoreductase [Polyangiaceae bacterium]|nr:FAD-dependent oxidoreductase [Polyangiaceae bacterium]